MKRTNLMMLASMSAIILFTGCDSVNKVEDYAQKFEPKMEKIERHLENIEKQLEKVEVKKGRPCDHVSVLESLKDLMDENSDGEYQVDRSHIVNWDYNSIGRYTCKAKVKKISEKNPLGKKISSFTSAAYGLSDGGWVHYSTYITTDEYSFYVTLKSGQ